MEELTFKIIEIFDSIDGEGKRTGELATFVRLAGCNLRCSYCDTKYGLDYSCGDSMTINEIIDKCKSFHNKNITLTGGEPLGRVWVEELIKALCIEGFEVNIETNGSIPLTKAPRYKNMFYTMDYKCPSSGEEHRMELSNLEFLDETDVLKFVVGSKEDLMQTKSILDNYNIKAQVYLSPVFNNIQPVEIVNFIKQHKETFKNAKVQVQLHKIIWDPQERGV